MKYYHLTTSSSKPRTCFLKMLGFYLCLNFKVEQYFATISINNMKMIHLCLFTHQDQEGIHLFCQEVSIKHLNTNRIIMLIQFFYIQIAPSFCYFFKIYYQYTTVVESFAFLFVIILFIVYLFIKLNKVCLYVFYQIKTNFG